MVSPINVLKKSWGLMNKKAMPVVVPSLFAIVAAISAREPMRLTMGVYPFKRVLHFVESLRFGVDVVISLSVKDGPVLRLFEMMDATTFHLPVGFESL